VDSAHSFVVACEQSDRGPYYCEWTVHTLLLLLVNKVIAGCTIMWTQCELFLLQLIQNLVQLHNFSFIVTYRLLSGYLQLYQPCCDLLGIQLYKTLQLHGTP